MSKRLSDKKRAQLIAKLRKIEDPNSAIQFLSTAIREFPGDSELYRKRGIKYASIWEADKALADHEKAIKLNPNNADAMIARATILLLQENYEEAKLGFDEIITKIETEKKLHWNKIKKRVFKISVLVSRGIAKTHTGNFAGAIEDLDAAITLKPSQGVLQKIDRVKTNLTTNLGKEHLEASVEIVSFLPEIDEIIKILFMRGVSVLIVSLCIVAGIRSCVIEPVPETVYTEEPTGETEEVSGTEELSAEEVRGMLCSASERPSDPYYYECKEAGY